MGQSVEVVTSELHSAAARLADAGQRLQDGLSSVDLEVGQLMGSGWKGGAASAYKTEWDKWHGGAGQVIRGLQTMSELLTQAAKAYDRTDQQGGESVESSFQPGGAAGGRPGGVSEAAATTGQAPTVPGGAGSTDSPAQPMNLAEPATQAGGQAVQGIAQAAGQLVGGLTQAVTGFAQEVAGLSQQVGELQSPGDEAPDTGVDEDKREDKRDDRESEETDREVDGAGGVASSGRESAAAPAPVEPPTSGTQTLSGDDHPMRAVGRSDV